MKPHMFKKYSSEEWNQSSLHKRGQISWRSGEGAPELSKICIGEAKG